jgi:thiamine biosynthesis lipoprotein
VSTPQGLAPASTTFRAIGTTASVLTAGPKVLGAAAVLLRLQLEQLDEACSRFRPGSELSLAHRSGGKPVVVSGLLAELVQASLDVARLTEGAVDPTVGNAVIGLGYDRDFDALPARGPRVGDSPPVPAPGWECVELDVANRLLRIPEGVRLDLGSSAKAFAADRAARAIAADLGTGVLVNLGGDVAVAGPPPPDGWCVGISMSARDHPEHSQVTVCIRSGGLASSGTTVRAWRRGERRLHHIVDPRTGDVADEYWQLATVAAGSCLVANAASTAAIVKGSGASQMLCEMALPARLVRSDGEVFVFNGWPSATRKAG